MDTYHYVNSAKCTKCYKCIELCTEMNQARYGTLGFMILDEYDGCPEYENDYPICRNCEAEVNGKKVSFPCNHICPTGAMEIRRF